MQDHDHLEKLQAAIKASRDAVDPWDKPQSDDDILDALEFPTPVDDSPYLPDVNPVHKLSDPTPEDLPQLPRTYGPIHIIKVLPTITNVLQRPQAMAQADLLQDGKPVRILVTGFGDRVALVEQLEEGAIYELRGTFEKRVKNYNGDKIPSLYLNLI